MRPEGVENKPHSERKVWKEAILLETGIQFFKVGGLASSNHNMPIFSFSFTGCVMMTNVLPVGPECPAAQGEGWWGHESGPGPGPLAKRTGGSPEPASATCTGCSAHRHTATQSTHTHMTGGEVNLWRFDVISQSSAHLVDVFQQRVLQ